MRKIGFVILFVSVCLSLSAQVSKLDFKGSWMLTDLTLSNSNTEIKVSGLIDTGCTYCVLDSTFVSECGETVTSSISSFSQKGREFVSIVFDSLVVCGKSFANVRCLVLDLRRGFGSNFNFLLGANVLSKGMWLFNQKDSVLEICDKSQTFAGTPLIWKNDKEYRYIPENGIVFAGELDTRQTLFYFDTGSTHPIINKGICKGKKTTNEAKVMTVDGGCVSKEISVFSDVGFKIGNSVFSCDFVENIINKKKYNTINIDIMKGRSFVLDYPNRTLIVME